MGERLSKDVWARVITAAMAEARGRGDRRLGTEHLLLGLLREESGAASVLGCDVDAARAGLDALDWSALALVGIEVGEFRPAGLSTSGKRMPLTSAARAALHDGAKQARRGKFRRPTARHLLLALVAGHRPDPVAELLAHLGIDPHTARNRLEEL